MTNLTEEIQNELKNLILENEKNITFSFNDERRLALLELVRAMDFFVTGFIAAPEWAEARGRLFRHIEYGLYKVLFIHIDESCNKTGAALFQSDKELQIWADSVLQYSGKLGFCEHFTELHRLDLVEIRKTDDKTYYIYPTCEALGAEISELENLSWRRELKDKNNTGIAEALNSLSGKIRDKQAELVDSWETHYIRYSADSEIDSFYAAKALLLCDSMLGYDSFPKDSKFGGLEFNLYCSAVSVFVGWTLKHIGFCFELLNKSPGTDPRNILTIISDGSNVIESLKSAMTVDSETAQQLMDIMTLTVENKVTHCSVPGNPISPAFIQISDTKLLRPVWGNFGEPFLFMLRELKRRYPGDWDKAVFAREQHFRNELYLLFNSERFFLLDRNVNLKVKGKIVTDIDALIFDRETGIIAIFQLKWQCKVPVIDTSLDYSFRVEFL